MTSTAHDAIAKMPQLPQAQYTLDQQLSELAWAANKLGLYDAADYLNQRTRRSAVHPSSGADTTGTTAHLTSTTEIR